MTTIVHALQQRHARTAPWAGAATTPGRRLLLLVGGDVAAVMAALLVTGAPPWAFALVPVTLLALANRGQYRLQGALDTLRGIVVALSVAAGLVTLAATALGLEPHAIAHAWVLSGILLAAHRLAGLAGRRGQPGTATVVLGGGDEADAVARCLAADPAAGLRPVAVLGLDLTVHQRDADARGLARLAREAGGREVVVLPGGASDDGVARIARACAAEGLGVAVRSAVGEAGGALAIEHAGPVSLVRLRPVDARDWRFAVKHAADRIVAAFALLCIAPLFAGLAVAVRLGSPGPVFFRQRRVGRDGREFDMLKFRSMRTGNAGDPVAELREGLAPGGVEGADRRTRVGRLLRRTSLDELPQLLNVLLGDMSLVGPRPERPEFVDRFSHDVDRYADRHRIKSGMTGLAQVNGLRGQTSIRDRVAYDNHYAEHWSLWLDVKILLRTVRAVFEPAE